jgi:hypothetical protein
MYRYMISYIDQHSSGFTNGNVEVRLPQPIRDMDDVDRITRELRDHHGLSRPLVMGFSPFVEGGR